MAVNVLRKCPDMGISLRRDPFTTVGNLESGGGARIRGTLKDEWRRALGTGHLSARDFMEGTLGEGSFTGDHEKYIKQGSEKGICYYWGSGFWGTRRGASFLGLSYLEEFLWGFREICKMPCKWVSLSIGPPLGNLEGVRLLGFLREKESISGLILVALDPEDIKILNLGAIWNFSKGTGLT